MDCRWNAVWVCQSAVCKCTFFNRLCVSSGRRFGESNDLITKDCLDWSKVEDG